MNIKNLTFMKTRLTGIAAVALIIALLVLYVLEFDHLNRTLDAGWLVRWSVGAGGVLGAVAGILLAKRAKSTEDRLPFFFGAFLACALLAPLAGSLSNRLMANPKVQQASVEFHLEEVFYAGVYGFLLGSKPEPRYRSFFYWGERMYKVQTRRPMFSGRYRGEQVNLSLHKGLWGFYFIPKPHT